MSEKEIQKAIGGKKCLAEPPTGQSVTKQGSVRSNVKWIPTAEKKFVEASSTLDAYHKQNGILPHVGKSM